VQMHRLLDVVPGKNIHGTINSASKRFLSVGLHLHWIKEFVLRTEHAS